MAVGGNAASPAPGADADDVNDVGSWVVVPLSSWTSEAPGAVGCAVVAPDIDADPPTVSGEGVVLVVALVDVVGAEEVGWVVTVSDDEG